MPKLILFLILISVVSTASSSLREAVTLPTGFFQLSGTDVSLTDNDLKGPAQALLKEAKVISIGDVVPGSEGFYGIKVRLIRYLIEKRGFRFFGMEENWVSSHDMEVYVDTCQGDPLNALKAFYPTEQAQVVLDLFKWICQFNLAHPHDHVAFRGFDIQDPWKTGPAFHEFLKRSDPANAEALFSKLDTCSAGLHVRNKEEYRQTQEYKNYKGKKDPIPSDANDHCISEITAIRKYLASNQRQIELSTSLNDFKKATLLLSAIEGWQLEMFNSFSDEAAHWNQRDHHMAELFQTLRNMDGRNPKTVIWSHFVHVMKHTEDLSGINDTFAGVPMLGSYLLKSFGKSYRALLVTGYEVEDTTMSGAAETHTAKSGSLESQLHNIGQGEDLLVDPNSSAIAPGVTAIIDSGDAPMTIDLRHQFDGVVFVNHSSAYSPAGFMPFRL